MRTVKKTSVFPAPREIVFAKLQELSTLQYIAAPYATFTPVDPDDPMILAARLSIPMKLILMPGGKPSLSGFGLRFSMDIVSANGLNSCY